MATIALSQCACGNRKSRYANKCRKCESAARTARIAEAMRIVQSGKCPSCGNKLRHNLALAGWWQCSQLGAVGFRADSSRPSCNFQVFTE
jgi:hypothetical protein